MARKKKTITYEFADGEVEMPSTFLATCTKTGEVIPIYHKILYKTVVTKYKNKFQYFLKHFVKRGVDKEPKVFDEKGDEVIDKFKLNAYSNYLIICYKELQNKHPDPDDITGTIKLQKDKAYIADCFQRNFNRDIEQHIKELT